MTLPGTEEESGRFAFGVAHKDKRRDYAWVWLERLDPKKARVPNPAVLALRVASLASKDLMLQADPVRFFTEPHYNGYPAVLLRLAAVRVRELRALLTDAWRCVARPPKGPRATSRTTSKRKGPRARRSES